MTRNLNKSLDALFPIRERALYRCFSCGWETSFQCEPYALLIYDECPECGEHLGDGREKTVYRTDDGLCRVCSEPASANRTRYCSERCKEIAGAVQGLFSWSSVRERVLERDDHRCQACGEGVTEDAPGEPEVDHIQPISEDGHPFDERNLITLCSECHGEKTHQGTDLTELGVDGERSDGLGLTEHLTPSTE